MVDVALMEISLNGWFAIVRPQKKKQFIKILKSQNSREKKNEYNDKVRLKWGAKIRTELNKL